MIRCFVTVVGPYVLLPYFLRYYSRAGVDRFVFNAFEPDPERYDRIEQVFEDCDVSYERGFWEREEIHNGRNRTRRVRKLVSDGNRKFLSDWTLYPDMDEFAEFPGGNIRKYVDSLPGAVRIVQGEWWDRITEDGSLAEIVPERALEEQFPVMAKLSCLFAATTHVIVACKGFVPPGHHPKVGRQAAKRAFSDLIPVHHFKWNSVVADRTIKRSEHYTATEVPNAPKVAKLAEYLETHEKLPIDDVQSQLRDLGCVLGI